MINLKTEKEIEIMKEGGKMLGKIVKELVAAAKPGVATQELDKLAKELLFNMGARSSFLNYGGFPSVLCVSVNEEIVHGVPSERILEKGDLVKLDMGVLLKGFHTDSATTVLVGGGISFDKRTALKKKLIKVARESLELGIKEARPGKTLGDVGFVIQKHVEDNGFNVVRDLVGHGIGRELHEPPQVPNYGVPGEGEVLKPGMVIAIEPMVVEGGWKIKEGPDGFVFETKDGGLAVHEEHTIVITEKGPLVITRY